MNKELNIFTLRMLRDQYEAEHLDTEVEALDAAIKALEHPSEENLVDDTLFITIDTDLTKVGRVMLSQRGTHWGDLFYPDNESEDDEDG